MLTQEGLLLKLEAWGEKTTSQTLRNREKIGLVGPAYRGGAGRPGRSVFYPERVLWENYAASKMLNSPKMRLTANEVVAARTLALRLEKDPIEIGEMFYDKPEVDQLDLRFAEIWHSLVVYAWLDCPPAIIAKVSFYDNRNRHYYCYVKEPSSENAVRLFITVNPSNQRFHLKDEQDARFDWRISENLINYDALF